MHVKYLSILLIVLLIASCKRSLQNNDITKIKLVKTASYDTPGADIIIDSSLAYKYFGATNAQSTKTAYYNGTISSQFWDTLNLRFKRLNYGQHEVSDSVHLKFESYFKFKVYWKNGENQITKLNDNDSNNGQDKFLNELIWLNSSTKTVKLNKLIQAQNLIAYFKNK